MISQNRFSEYLVNFLKKLSQDDVLIEQNSLLLGDAGLLFLLLFCKKHVPIDTELKSHLDKIIVEGLNQCLDIVSTADVNNPIGDIQVSSVMLLLSYGGENQSIEEIEDLINELIPMIYRVFFYKLSSKNFDLFHGCSGDLVQLLNIEVIDPSIFDYYIDTLISDAQSDDAGIVWHSVGKSGERYVNLGVPHGLCGILLILLKLFEKGRLKNVEIIYQVVNSLKNRSVDSAKYGFFFPGTTSVKGEDIKSSVLSWCYGDLGAAYAFLLFEKLFGESEFRTEGLKLTKNAIKRVDWLADNRSPLSICHGLPSIAYLFFKIFKVTGCERCRERSMYWTERSINFLEANYAPENISKAPIYLKNSLIYGIPGTAISLFSICQDRIYPEFDDLILL